MVASVEVNSLWNQKSNGQKSFIIKVTRNIFLLMWGIHIHKLQSTRSTEGDLHCLLVGSMKSDEFCKLNYQQQSRSQG